ncbi:hypothetical protein [Phycicoccus ginsengisoli]
MSTPPVPPDRDARHDRRDPDPDPTGIRALLGSLPDPGPMPEDLVARIHASIAAEQAARTDHTVVPLRARRGWGWKHLGVAAAAVVALGIGIPALAGTGPGNLMAALTGGSASDSAAGSAASEAVTSAPPPGTASPGIATGDRAAGAAGPVTIVGTGTAYTAAALLEQVRASQARGPSPGKGAGSSRAAGPADSVTGLRTCLTTLGVEAWMPVWADAATYQGHDAVVAVVSSDTGRVVYAVSPACDRTHPDVLTGPLRLS